MYNVLQNGFVLFDENATKKELDEKRRQEQQRALRIQKRKAFFKRFTELAKGI